MPRKHLSIFDFTRPQKHLSDRLIILSCEGFVTEEKYFNILSEDIFSGIQCRLTREIQKRFKTIEKAGIR